MKSYDFEEKIRWRKWVWKKSAQLLRWQRLSPKKAKVLYLAGPCDYDRAEALKNGFQPRNLWIAERDKKIVQLHRKDKKLVMHGDFSKILFTLSEDRELIPSVAIADLCSGFVGDLEELNDAFSILAGKHLMRFRRCPVIAVNIMRGRDADSNIFRQQEVCEKHRGKAFYQWARRSWELIKLNPQRLKSYSAYGDGAYRDVAPVVLRKSSKNEVGMAMTEIDAMLQWSKAKFNSYRSVCGVYMDSLVMCYSFIDLDDYGLTNEVDDEIAFDDDNIYTQLKKQLTAIKAVQTRRGMILNGGRETTQRGGCKYET